MVFHLNSATAVLTPAATPFWSARPGSGPRHLAWSPDGRVVFCTNELDSTVDTLAWSEPTASLHSLGYVSSLPPGFPPNTAFVGEILASARWPQRLRRQPRRRRHHRRLQGSTAAPTSSNRYSSHPAVAKTPVTSPSTPPAAGSSSATRTATILSSSSATATPESSPYRSIPIQPASRCAFSLSEKPGWELQLSNSSQFSFYVAILNKVQDPVFALAVACFMPSS
jgi:hypothetical protein